VETKAYMYSLFKRQKAVSMVATERDGVVSNDLPCKSSVFYMHGFDPFILLRRCCMLLLLLIVMMPNATPFFFFFFHIHLPNN
jgi:hypothetical protein